MLLPEANPRLAGKLILAALMAGVLVSASACTVRPLHGNGSITGDQSAASALSAIEVKPVETRQALQVRNHLIFLLSGGAGQPADPSLMLDLNVTSTTTSGATVQIATDNEPSAGTVTMKAKYTLRVAATGDVVSNGNRVTAASFDRLRQEFATLRAELDAENRAARELAELLRLAIVHDLEKRGSL